MAVQHRTVAHCIPATPAPARQPFAHPRNIRRQIGSRVLGNQRGKAKKERQEQFLIRRSEQITIALSRASKQCQQPPCADIATALFQELNKSKCRTAEPSNQSKSTKPAG